MGLKIRKAVREQIFTKIALMGASGSGKSYSALRLAIGMKERLEKIENHEVKILVANTEGSRGLYYANEFDYDIADIDAPYTPEKYIELIDDAVEAGYEILILDSVSPEWEGKGGCLEMHQMLGGRMQDWANISPRHDKFLDAIEKSPIHIIATLKGKDQYEIDKDEKGKVSVKKLGLGTRQREGFEYRFTCTFSIDQKTHLALAQKDNTHIFENSSGEVLTEKYGERIIEWANSSTIAPSKEYIVVNNATQREEQEKLYLETREKIKEIALALREAKKTDVYNNVITTYLAGKKVSECSIEDLPSMCRVLDALSETEIN